MKPRFEDIPVEAIAVEDRLRETDDSWVEVLAAMIEQTCLQNPIEVIEDGDKFRLIAGAHRLAAVKLLKRQEIFAQILDPAQIEDSEIRMREILENIGRHELTVLDRARYLSELKSIYEILHPDYRHGGDRKSQGIRNKKKNQVAILAIRSEIASKVDLSERSIYRAIQIYSGLTPKTRKRLQGTPLANHQAGLILLAQQKPERQAEILDLMLYDPPKAGSVADAIVLADGRRLPSATDKAFSAVQGTLTRLPKTQRLAVFDSFEPDIREWAEKRGWKVG